LKKPKLVRITTVPVSMNIILKGQLQFMNQFFEVIGVTGYDEKHFEDVRKREGIRMEDIKMERRIAPFADLMSLWNLYRFLKKEQPEVVHTHTPKAGLLGMLAAWLARVPVRLHTVAGMPLMEVKGPKRILLNVIEKITYACAHKVYPNSKGLKDFILDQEFCAPQKLKVIANGASNGVNTAIFKPDFVENHHQYRRDLRMKLGIPPDYIVLGFVGRIAREKGMQELFDAFSVLQKEGKYKLKMVLIGLFEKQYGQLGEELEDQLQNHPDIHALGRFDDVRPYYLISDIFVFPSYREGFPNAVMEAGAMGLPSIVTDINGCNEIVVDGENGIIIPPKNSEKLKVALQQLLDDAAGRDRIAKKARPRIEDYFRRELIWESLLEEYTILLKKQDINVKQTTESLS